MGQVSTSVRAEFKETSKCHSVPRPERIEGVGTGVGAHAAPKLPPIPPERAQEFLIAQAAKAEVRSFALLPSVSQRALL